MDGRDFPSDKLHGENTWFENRRVDIFLHKLHGSYLSSKKLDGRDFLSDI